MGYTHYYYVAPEFDKGQFAKVAKDFKKMVTPLKRLGVILADGMGENRPTISPTKIEFNGLVECSHNEGGHAITWPSDKATGTVKNGIDAKLLEITKSQWFAKAHLETRSCRGDCSHETFYLEQKSDPATAWSDEGAKEKYFQFCKTAYKPYDLAVNVCLVIAKRHLKDDIAISSDGEITDWEEAMHLCQHFLGYGSDFTLDE